MVTIGRSKCPWDTRTNARRHGWKGKPKKPDGFVEPVVTRQRSLCRLTKHGKD